MPLSIGIHGGGQQPGPPPPPGGPPPGGPLPFPFPPPGGFGGWAIADPAEINSTIEQLKMNLYREVLFNYQMTRTLSIIVKAKANRNVDGLRIRLSNPLAKPSS